MALGLVKGGSRRRKSWKVKERLKRGEAYASCDEIS